MREVDLRQDAVDEAGVELRPRWKSGLFMMKVKNGIVVMIPSTRYSASARRMRAMASSRVCAVHDELREHRVVEHRHGVAGVDAVVVAHARSLREVDVADEPRRRRELPRRILGVDAALDRVAEAAEVSPA